MDILVEQYDRKGSAMTAVMRKYVRVIVCWLGCGAMLLFSGCGAVHTPDITTTPVLDISGNEPDLSFFESLSKGEELEEPVIIKIAKGFSLPVHIAVNTPIATMESSCSNLVFSRDLYLYVSNQGMLVSPDTRQWVDITELEAVKELFGGDKGEIAVSIGAGKQKEAQLDLKVIVHPRLQ